MSQTSPSSSLLERLVSAIERLAPAPRSTPDFTIADAFVWQATAATFQSVETVNRLPLRLLRGIDMQLSQLKENTERFAKGLPANNALLWGARGMGKSSLVKAVHGAVAADTSRDQKLKRLKLVEIHREDINTLPHCLTQLRNRSEAFIIFTDDLSFDADDTSYKSLKAVLEGGVEGRPDNVIFYATSNRRHLMPRDMVENERATALHPSEAVEEKVSHSDRFGLWLGFHSCSPDEYLEMVRGYADHFDIAIVDTELKRQALAWSMARGARSGRVAWQFIQDLAGRQGVCLAL
ncbi:MAG: ATP-binding protein [Alphaproteobacteria bacterium]|nr:ATP-binding protein [Alphaproteobacteria bacterium]